MQVKLCKIRIKRSTIPVLKHNFYCSLLKRIDVARWVWCGEIKDFNSNLGEQLMSELQESFREICLMIQKSQWEFHQSTFHSHGEISSDILGVLIGSSNDLSTSESTFPWSLTILWRMPLVFCITRYDSNTLKAEETSFINCVTTMRVYTHLNSSKFQNISKDLFKWF